MTYTGQGEFGSKVQCLHLVWHNLVLLVLRLYLNSVLNYVSKFMRTYILWIYMPLLILFSSLMLTLCHGSSNSSFYMNCNHLVISAALNYVSSYC